jgi:hypothetical protein
MLADWARQGVVDVCCPFVVVVSMLSFVPDFDLDASCLRL